MKNINRIITHAQGRPVLWSAISCFEIEPPEPFYSQMVVDMAHTRFSEHIHGHEVNLVRSLSELKLLGRLGMVERLPQAKTERVIWHQRINQPAWDEIAPKLDAALERAAQV